MSNRWNRCEIRVSQFVDVCEEKCNNRMANEVYSLSTKLKEHLNVVDADSHFLRILPIVSRKARNEKIRHYYLCITLKEIIHGKK